MFNVKFFKEAELDSLLLSSLSMRMFVVKRVHITIRHFELTGTHYVRADMTVIEGIKQGFSQLDGQQRHVNLVSILDIT